jgi:hypothetical protein
LEELINPSLPISLLSTLTLNTPHLTLEHAEHLSLLPSFSPFEFLKKIDMRIKTWILILLEIYCNNPSLIEKSIKKVLINLYHTWEETFLHNNKRHKKKKGR